MSSKRVAVVVGSIALLVTSGLAQKNELSATFGRTFVSSQQVQGANFFDNSVHFGDEETLAGNYARLLKTRSVFGLKAEVPFAWIIDQDLNFGKNLIPESYWAIFVTPSLRLQFFPAESVTPWVSAGGGYGHFRASDQLVFGGPNPGTKGTNTGVFQFGAGLDIWPWQRWGFRLEARDFYSGVPNLNVDTGRSRQHNYYVGGGVIRRF